MNEWETVQNMLVFILGDEERKIMLLCCEGRGTVSERLVGIWLTPLTIQGVID